MHRRGFLHAAVAVPAAGAAPSAEGGTIARVRRILAPLRYGVNVERGEV